MDAKTKNFIKISKKFSKINLHLGCGKRNFPNFINIDSARYKHLDFCTSVDNLNFIPQNSCDYIYASHVLEYFDFESAKKILNIWRKLLKKHAMLRISVPDLNSLIKVYNKTKDIKKIIGPMYGKINNNNSFIYHKFLYDFKTIFKLLKSVGFRKIKKYDWRKTFHSKFDDHSQAYFPHMDKKNGIQISLNIECIK